ncbi:hypothetical protein MKX01_023975 [Papaver californicum]|nr:hypothetical protein MKX01_023975 [Papaver californicum]
MGYDCAKLWVRFDSLKSFSEQEQVVSLKLEETTSKRRDKEVKATLTHTRISELEAELKKLKASSKTREEEIETLKSTERSYTEEGKQILQKFRSAVTDPW